MNCFLIHTGIYMHMNTVPALYYTVLIMKRLPVYNDIPLIQNEFCWDILVLLRNSST